jgi:hypothetical protein
MVSVAIYPNDSVSATTNRNRVDSQLDLSKSRYLNIATDQSEFLSLRSIGCCKGTYVHTITSDLDLCCVRIHMCVGG